MESEKSIIINKINIKNDILSSLHSSCMENDFKTSENLIKNGADVDLKDNYGQTPLFGSIASENKRIIELILNSSKIKRIKELGLNYSCEIGSKKMALHLIVKGAKINYEDDFIKTSILIACYYDNFNLAKILLKIFTSIKSINDSGQTILHISAQMKDSLLTKILKKYNFNINSTDNSGYTALHYASMKNSKENVKYLIKMGINLFAKNYGNWNALHLACSHNNIEIVDILSNFILDTCENFQTCALFIAFSYKYNDICQLLISKVKDNNVKQMYEKVNYHFKDSLQT